MKHHVLTTAMIIILFAAGCKREKPQEQSQAPHDTLPAREEINHHPLTMAAIYQQVSAEKYALEYQAFKLAKFALKENLMNQEIDQQRAVILDIDETVLDNSPYEAMLVKEDTTYPYRWGEWLEKADAKALAGVEEFLEFARGYGVDIFYITNRKEIYREATLKNLRDHNLPQAETAHLFMRTNTSSKKERRENVQENYHIALLIGDNLNDFSEIFEEKSNHIRKKLVDKYSEEFGSRFILLPNATYGDWEAAVYDYDFSLDEKTKHEERLKSLNAF